MKKIIISIIVLALLVIAPSSFATTYYVSELFGDDNNDGLSEATPFATIQKAADVMVAGDMVIVDFGEYHETIVPKNNGTAGNPIVYQAKELGEAEISFGETTLLPIFTLHSGSIYVMDNVFRTINALTEDGMPLTKKDSLAALGIEAGWYHDRATTKLYIRSTDDTDPAVHADTVIFAELSFDIVEGSHIVIDGFRIYNGVHAVVAKNEVSLPGLVIKNNVLGKDDVNNFTAITLDGGEADSVHTYEEFLIDNNIFENNAAIKLMNAGRNSVISSNTFNGNPELGETGAEVISIRASTNFPGAQTQGLVIERNFFNNPNHRVAYFRSGGDIENVTFQNNIIFGGFFGTMRVRNGKNIDIINNTFFYTTRESHMIRFGDGVSARAYNNILAYVQRSYTWFVDNKNDSTLLVDIDYNYYVTDSTLTSSRDDQLVRVRIAANGEYINSSSLPGGPHAIYGHPMKAQKDTIQTMMGDTLYVDEIPDMETSPYPLFVDADTVASDPEKLRLVEGCPAIDAAYATLAPAVDFFGNLRDDDKPDIGAIEYGVSAVETYNKLFPRGYELSQNYPNPFNPGTTIKYKLPKSGKIKLIVYNVLGQKVATLYNGIHMLGTYSMKWNGMDDQGHAVPSGIYFYRLEAGSFTKTAKMTLLK